MPETSDGAVGWRDAGDGVLHAVLQRPPANALGPPIIDGLQAALDAADSDPGCKAIVISSELPGFFAAGADIKHMSSIDAESFVAYGDTLRAAMDRLAAGTRPAIAAIDGLALGGGLELAMACTLRVGGADAEFGLPEVKLGLIPGAGGTQRLPRLVGRGRALEMMLTGRQVGAEEAHRMGLIERLTPTGAAATAALGLARELAALSLPAQQALIRTVDAAADLPLAEGLRLEVAEVKRALVDGEGREGMSAFLEKRRPRFD